VELTVFGQQSAEDSMTRTSISQKTAALALSGALLIGAAAPALAAPLPGNGAGLATAAGTHVIDVRWRHRGGAVAAGIAAGLIGGALIGAATAPGYYYPPSYYGPPPPYGPYYGPVYAEPPVVYEAPPRVVYEPAAGPNGPGRMCWVSTDKDRGYGYWRPC
jgi:hypothetical protein